VANDSTYSIRPLDGRAVGDGVGEGHSELDEVCMCQLRDSDRVLGVSLGHCVPAPPASIPSMMSGVS
jgi:hypothetical protein